MSRLVPSAFLVETVAEFYLSTTPVEFYVTYVIGAVPVCMILEAGVRVQRDVGKSTRVQQLRHYGECLLQISFAIRRCVVV